ncbi:MAG: cation diffusion facilitator family transporter, partial [Dehalococcoidia bacterium]
MRTGTTFAPARAASRKGLRLVLLIIGTFFVVEALGGYFTNSLALLSDAGHLLSDVGALVLALVALQLALRPASPRRTFGYQRAEILAALINGLTLWGVAAYIGYEASRRFLEPPQVHALPMVLIATTGLGAQLLGASILKATAYQSLNVRGAFLHVATDAL